MRSPPGPRTDAISSSFSRERLGFEDLDVELDACIFELLEEPRTKAKGFDVAARAPGVVDPHTEVVEEEVLHRDDVALHADDFSDVRDAACAILQTSLVDNQLDRTCHLLADRANRQVHAGH